MKFTQFASIGAALALLLPGSLNASTSARLDGLVRGGQITLRVASGRIVKRLKAGTYTLVVTDRSRSDNFVLTGTPMTNVRQTQLSFVGTVRWRLKLRKGVYRYFSTAHRQTMQGTFKVV